MPPRRDSIVGFDRLHGIEIADLADRLVEVWPFDDDDTGGDVAQCRALIDALERSAGELARLAADLRGELARIEREAAAR